MPDDMTAVLATIADHLKQRLEQEDRSFAFHQEQAKRSVERIAKIDEESSSRDWRKDREENKRRMEEIREEGQRREKAEQEFRKCMVDALDRLGTEMQMQNERLIQILNSLKR
jgi:hypothetical protein